MGHKCGAGHWLTRMVSGCPKSVRLQVVFLGLGLVIPLVTGELLQFPKLVRSFFNLMSYMLEIYPDHVAGLPGKH